MPRVSGLPAATTCWPAITTISCRRAMEVEASVRCRFMHIRRKQSARCTTRRPNKQYDDEATETVTRSATCNAGRKPAPRTPRVGNNPFSSAQPVERAIPRSRHPTGRTATRRRSPTPALPQAICLHVRPARGPAAPAVRAVAPGRQQAVVPVVLVAAAAVVPVVAVAVTTAPADPAAVTRWRRRTSRRRRLSRSSRRRWSSRSAWRCGWRVRSPRRRAQARPQVEAGDAPSTRTCRRRSAACGCRTATARPSGSARGASLSDFAEKIDANPAALVQALFNLGRNGDDHLVGRRLHTGAARQRDELQDPGGCLQRTRTASCSSPST